MQQLSLNATIHGLGKLHACAHDFHRNLSLAGAHFPYITGEFVYVVTAAEGIILSSLFIGRKQR